LRNYRLSNKGRGKKAKIKPVDFLDTGNQIFHKMASDVTLVISVYKLN